MKKRILMFVLFLTAVLLLVPASATAVAPNLAGLQAGEAVSYDHEVPINIVFIGYEESDINEADLTGILPATYDPVVRFPQFYGLPGRDLGIDFNFDYNLIYTNTKFEDRLFSHLGDIGSPGDLTLFQQFYNDNANNVLDIEGPVLFIDGPSVEQYLSRQARVHLDIDTKKSYTIFYINWYGRDDFQHHVYTKTDEPDPDTGYNFGEIRDSRKMIAWGGSHSRTWFYDLSAGPEAWSNNFDVDNPDLDGNGFEDYRMPPIWEYTAGGYRDASQLGFDLGLVTRFVGINLLFTPSPLYDPLVTAPSLAGDKVTHVEMLQDDPANNGLNWIDQGIIYDELSSFQPYFDWQVNIEQTNPIDSGASQSLLIFNGIIAQDDCWTPFGTTFAQMFCYFGGNYDTYVPAYEQNDYVAAVFAYNTTDANHPSGLLGFADDNWTDGTQSYIFQYDTPFFRSLGYGFSTTTIHEVGHHIGLSHPHDGYDAEFGIDYGPSDAFYFAWSGNESDSVMHYLALSSGFGQFNQDTMHRYETAGFLNWANELLAQVEADPNAHSVRHLVRAADRQARDAQRSLKQWNHLAAANSAYGAYQTMLAAADALGISPSLQAESLRLAAPAENVPHEGDPIRFPNN